MAIAWLNLQKSIGWANPSSPNDRAAFCAPSRVIFEDEHD
jgi:hypothetical protein